MMVEVAGTVAVKGSVKVENAVSVESLLKRAFMKLEDAGEDEDEYDDFDFDIFDKVLDINPECAEAYLGNLLLEYEVSKEADLAKLEEPFDSSKNYKKIMKFGSPELCARIKKINDGIVKAIKQRNAEFKKIVMPYAVKAARNPIACEKGERIVALRCDGTVAATGDNAKGQCNVSDWRDIIAVAAGSKHTVGLKSDGTVVAVGDNESGQCNVSEWTDIVALTAGADKTVGLKSDGKIVIARTTTSELDLKKNGESFDLERYSCNNN